MKRPTVNARSHDDTLVSLAACMPCRMNLQQQHPLLQEHLQPALPEAQRGECRAPAAAVMHARRRGPHAYGSGACGAAKGHSRVVLEHQRAVECPKGRAGHGGLFHMPALALDLHMACMCVCRLLMLAMAGGG